MAVNRTLRQGAQGPDVALLQKLLNTIPETLLKRLVEDGLFGKQTLMRVLEFQRNAKLVADGAIGPKSWAMLDELTKFLLPPGTIPGTVPGTTPAVDAWRSDPYREAVLKVALAEALPVSNVTDALQFPVPPNLVDLPPMGTPPTASPKAWRFGWQRLKQYYEECAIGVSPNYWRQTGRLKIAGNIEIISYLDGVRGHDWRVPAFSNTEGTQWCGIFATWCWLKAGVPTKWQFGVGPRGAKARGLGPGSAEPKPGDILVQSGGRVHHSLLLEPHDGKSFFTVVNGNSERQSIRITNDTVSRSSVQYVYSLEDFG